MRMKLKNLNKGNGDEAGYRAFRDALSLKIRKLRQDRQWTLEKAEEMGFPSWRHLQRIESGRNFTVRTLWRICKLFQIAPSDLFKK